MRPVRILAAAVVTALPGWALTAAGGVIPPVIDDCGPSLAGVSTIAAPDATATPAPWWDWSRASGGWGGTRDRWAAAGVSIDAFYTADVSALLTRGTQAHHTASRGLFQLGASVDLHDLAGWRGGSLFAGLHAFRGANGSDALGDIQGYSNIDAAEFEGIAELWFEQRLVGDRLRLKIGRVDANSEFAFTRAGMEFLHSSAGFSPTILFLPTYPYPASSVNAFVRPTSGLELGFGLYDRPVETAASGDDPHALFSIGQVAVVGRGGRRLGPRRLTLGAWHDSARISGLDDRPVQGTDGWYAVLEQRLTTGRRGTGLDLFLQYGRADERAGEFAEHWSLGFLAPGPPGRPEDSWGLMVSGVDLSDLEAAGFAYDETTIELFYGIALTPFVRVKPDLQLVIHPSGEDGRRLVGTIRFEIGL